LIAAGARSANAVGGQLFNVFAISYRTKTLGLPPSIGLTGVMLANLIGIPATGLLCDRLGREPVYLGGCHTGAHHLGPAGGNDAVERHGAAGLDRRLLFRCAFLLLFVIIAFVAVALGPETQSVDITEPDDT
jgi:MFS family permease